MQTTNIPVTENPTNGSRKLSLMRKYIASLIAGKRIYESGNYLTTARGRALYTIDCFMNGKPVLPKHDGLHASLRRAFAN